MERVYHPYWLWEDYKAGFYNNISGKEKKIKIEKVLEMFNDKEKTMFFMNKVIKCWTFSCEHNFTNPSLNRIAYLGQAACCMYSEIPNTITMEAWSLLSKDVKDYANEIARQTIEKWEINYKKRQLCLKLD